MLPQTRQFGQFYFYLHILLQLWQRKRPQSHTTNASSLSSLTTKPFLHSKNLSASYKSQVCEGHTGLLVPDLKNVLYKTQTCLSCRKIFHRNPKIALHNENTPPQYSQFKCKCVPKMEYSLKDSPQAKQ